MLNKKRLFIFGAACLITGAVQALPVNQYQGYTLNGFVKARYTGFYSMPHRGVNLMSNNRHTQSLNYYYQEGKPMSDGSYVYFAPFNASNVQLIERPRRELGYFCRMNGGSLKAIAYYTKNIVQQAYVDPVKTYLAVKSKLNALQYSTTEGANRVKLPLTPNAIEAAVRDEGARAQQANQFHDIQGSLAGYTAAVRAGAFGKFTCVADTTGQQLWNVSIIPMLYKPAHSDNFAAEALYIGINPGG